MRDYLNIAATPVDEDCVPCGENLAKQRAECNAFIGQLRRQFGEEPEGARLSVKAFQHDYGTYYEVVCYYDDKYTESVDYAFKLEAETPEKWDDKALMLLAKTYPEYLARL